MVSPEAIPPVFPEELMFACAVNAYEPSCLTTDSTSVVLNRILNSDDVSGVKVNGLSTVKQTSN